MDFQNLIESSKDKDIEILKEEISKIMLNEKYSTFSFIDFEFNGFYRARKHNHLLGNVDDFEKLNVFINEKEFWEVPKESAKIGRCNDYNESIFYCSSDFATTILEVKPKVGDYVTVANFKNILVNKPRFNIHSIGNGYLSSLPELKILFSNYFFDESQKPMDDFLDKLFHLNIKDDELYKYKLSIAVTKISLTDGVNARGDKIEVDGLIYPSIIRNQKSYCFALKPWIVHTFFKIFSIQTLKILEIEKDFIKISLLRNGEPMFDKIYPNDMFDVFWMIPPNETPDFDILKY